MVKRKIRNKKNDEIILQKWNLRKVIKPNTRYILSKWTNQIQKPKPETALKTVNGLDIIRVTQTFIQGATTGRLVALKAPLKFWNNKNKNKNNLTLLFIFVNV